MTAITPQQEGADAGDPYARIADLLAAKPVTPPEAPLQQWAVVELMGHRQAIGRVSEATLFGRAMVQVDRIDTEPEAVQYYGPEAVYCLTPVTEDQARLLAKSRYKTNIVPPALLAGLYAGEDDLDDERDRDEWEAEGRDTAMSAAERAEYDDMSEALLDAADDARDLEREAAVPGGEA